MKKTKFRERVRERVTGLKEVVSKYPVETFVAGLTMFAGLLFRERIYKEITEIWIAGPYLFLLAYLLNSIFTHKKTRIVYYLGLVPFIGLFFVPLDNWLLSSGYWFGLLCLVLAVPVVKKKRDNIGFIAENWWIFSGILISAMMVTVAFLLFTALVYATIELFNLSSWYGNRLTDYFAIFSYTVAFALLLLSYVDKRTGKVPEKTGVLSVMVNYIVTPALIAFNALYYAYIIRITLRWELPAGYVAIMILIFCLAAFGVKALRELLPKKRYGWYFENLSVIAVPALVLFWGGSIYRICQYGLTEWRIYLLICGMVMTVSLGLFVCKKFGEYRRCWITAILLLCTFTFIPPIEAGRLGIYCQEKRLARLAGQLDLMESPGRLKEIPALAETDPETVEKMIQLREALRYVYANSGKNYGVGNVYQYGANLDGDSSYAARLFICAHPGSKARFIETKGFSHIVLPAYLYSNEDWIYSDNNGHLSIFCRDGTACPLSPLPTGRNDDVPDGYRLVYKIRFRDMAAALMENAGISPGQLEGNNFEPTPQQENDLTIYEDDRLVIILTYLYLYPREEDLHFSNYEVSMILIKE